MVELEADKALSSAPLRRRSRCHVGGTRLGKALGGYRNLIRAPTRSACRLVSSLFELAADFCDLVPDMRAISNPVLIRKGSGEVRVVDALVRVDRRASVKHYEGTSGGKLLLLANGGVMERQPFPASWRSLQDRIAVSNTARERRAAIRAGRLNWPETPCEPLAEESSRLVKVGCRSNACN